jgi:DNA-binding XRE family transcriptional regulator
MIWRAGARTGDRLVTTAANEAQEHAMAKKWKTIPYKSTPERVARVRERAHLAGVILELDELRRRRGLTQAQLSEVIGITQGALSQIENSQNLELSTLRKVIESMGGKLRILVEFPDETVTLS